MKCALHTSNLSHQSGLPSNGMAQGRDLYLAIYQLLMTKDVHNKFESCIQPGGEQYMTWVI